MKKLLKWLGFKWCDCHSKDYANCSLCVKECKHNWYLIGGHLMDDSEEWFECTKCKKREWRVTRPLVEKGLVAYCQKRF